jgi:hypothetical protein
LSDLFFEEDVFRSEWTTERISFKGSKSLRQPFIPVKRGLLRLLADSEICFASVN